MNWNCFCSGKFGSMIIDNERANARVYPESILKPFYPFSVGLKKRNTSVVFMQDNVPAHTATVTKKYFSEKN